jgi:polyribonucleotide nucleotidyltransferase
MIIREKVRLGDQVITLETGRIAKQAGGSCLVRAGDTIVLVTACGNQEQKPGQSFFPLSVDYQEKTYAAGKIPGGFFKREGRLRDYEILTSRLIDRPCRPLFPEGYLSEVQVIATVMSFDQVNPPDILALIGASAALHISQIPWTGPIAGVRVGRIAGEFIANPTFEQMALSDCELLVAASRDAIVMVEGEADEMSEEDMIEALLFGHRSVQDTIDLIDRMRQAVGKTKWTFAGDTTPAILRERVRHVAGFKTREACSIANKATRGDAFKQVRREAVEILAPEFPGQENSIKSAFDELRYDTMRLQVLEEGRRLDGRDTRTVRPISIELGVLPRTHGSSLFTRGETQAIVTSTLGTARDSQRLDTLSGDVHKRFMLHYNFPPYSVGECKPMRGPGRREVGHGDLAERALAKMLPSKEEFPYAIRIVSEITESNGSSSMASVCGGALALMDAGVPIKAPVAGVAMGLIKEGERYAVLTDILGDEDALGDMDFKVCGTQKGVTAIQMDIKVEGLSREILERALTQAREARLHILDKMQRAISAPREELSLYAPRITQIRVKPDQIRTIIGPGGKMIRAIVDQTGANIDVEDDGTVNVSSSDSASVLKALEIIKSLTTEPEIGDIYEGTVKRIEPYGAFIEIMPGKDGLCHISDIDWSHVTSVEDYFKLGDKVAVKLTNIDREGRIRLSRKDAIPEPAGGASKLNGRAAEPREERNFDKPREERNFDKPREERNFDKPREERNFDKPREERNFDKPREERTPRNFDRDAPKPRDLDREERPARAPRDLDRDERVVAKPRDLDREERPAARVRDLDRDERVRDERVVAKPRDLDRDERPAARARDLDRDERPAPRARDLDRDERPVARARELERDDRVIAKPRDLERDERVIAKPRDLERDERPAARVRDLDHDDRVIAKPRDFDRGSRPARPRDLERDDRVIAKPRDLERDVRPARLRDDDERPARVRDLERDDRVIAKPRDLERDDRVIAKPRSLDRDEPVVAKSREPRDLDLPVKPRDLDRERAARLRDDEPPRRARPLIADERDDRPRARELDRERPIVRDDERELSVRTPRRDLDERPIAKARDLDERPVAKVRDLDDDRLAGPRSRDLGSRPRRELDERPIAKARDLDRDLAPRNGRRDERDLAVSTRPAARRDERDAAPEFAPRGGRREGRDLDRDVAPRLAPRDDDFDREVPPVVARRDFDERPARARGRDEAREVARPRDDVRPARRDVELDARPPRARRDDDDRLEPRKERVESDRPLRAARSAELPARELPSRDLGARAPKRGREDDVIVDEPAFADRAAAAPRERDDRVERDRPSRVRARARNRDRVREVERERERD